MKILLSKIHPSPKPIRSSWDEAKMEELRWSLMEEGQVEPIGLHESQNGYTIVWGHRRVEASRRAGWNDIEAVIVKKDEVDNLIQAGIENLSSEEMTIDDKADWVFRLNQLGLSNREIARRSGIEHGQPNEWSAYKREKDQGMVASGIHSREGDDGLKKILHVARVFGDDVQSKKVVLNKAVEDKLNRDQTRAVAEAYHDAPSPEVKKKILETPIQTRDTAADILRRSVNRVNLDQGIDSMNEVSDWQKEREERRSTEDFDFAVKEFLDSARLFLEVARKGSALVKYGKYSPEAAKFAIRKIDSLIDALKTYKEELEGVK